MPVIVVSFVVFLALVGMVFVVSIAIAPARLDCEAQKMIAERDVNIRKLTDKPKRSQAEEHYYQEAKEVVAKLSDPTKQVLRHLLTHEKLDAGTYDKVDGRTPQEVVGILNEFHFSPGTRLVRKQVSHHPRIVWWEIVPGYRSVLAELLYPPKAE